MTTEKSSAAADRKKILEEHRLIAALTGSIANAPDLREMAAGLEQLQPLLQQHFVREESQEGLHTSIRARAPQYVAAVERLVEDHRGLLARVIELRTRIAQGEAGAFHEAQEACRAIFSDLQEHEARENEVFLDTAWTDLGTGD